MMRITTAALLSLLALPAIADVSVTSTFKKWHPITVDNSGVTAALSEAQFEPNPFLDYRYNVIFTSPTGIQSTVPGYFAGDGMGGGIGTVWRAKFSANEVGEWQYRISFQSGDNIAIGNDAGTPLPSDGETGKFTVVDNRPDDPGFLAVGRLQYTGEHYLKFADGPYWIKGGIDSPENFFGYAGFDNTFDQPGGVNTEGLIQGLHQYQPHIADWRDGDPLFTNSANPDGAKGIIGAINYLASQGVNSLYFLPMNLGGDGQDTYPFIRPSGSEFDNIHYDTSKLFQWGIVLDHMQRNGVAAHFVLAETEQDNLNWLDDGQLGVERKLFFREIIARYSYLLAIKWNLSEESRFGPARHRSFAQYIADLDWADHPIAVHSTKDRPFAQYDDLLGNSNFSASSIQFSPSNSGAFVEEWRKKTTDAGWPWVIDMDEVGPAPMGVTPENTHELRKSVLYPVYFSGGNIEWYFGYHSLPLGGDMRTEDFRTREEMYRFTHIARGMMQNEMPFWRMQPADDLYTGTGSAEVFADAGEFYAIYLSDASSPGNVAVESGDYSLQWFNPRTGDYVNTARLIENMTNISLGNSPADSIEDWVVLIKRQVNDPESTVEPENTDNIAPNPPPSNVAETPEVEPVSSPPSGKDGTDEDETGDVSSGGSLGKIESTGNLDTSIVTPLFLLLALRLIRRRFQLTKTDQ